MRILDLYVGRQLLGSTFMVILVLVSVFSFFGLIDQLKDVGRGNYGVPQAIQFVLLEGPGLAYEMLPIAALIGCLLGLGNMVANSEYAVMRAAGVSLWQAAASIMKSAVVLVVVAIILGELVVPITEEYAHNARSVAMTSKIHLHTRNGFWARDGQSYINIRRLLPGDRVEGVYIYEFDDDNELRMSTYAREAHYQDQQWILEQIDQTDLGADPVTVRHIDKAVWTSLLNPELITVVAIKPSTLSTYSLVKYINYLKENSQNSQRYEQALWSKLIYPITIAVMVLLAIPLVLRATRSISVGQRVMLGSFVGIGFHIANQAAGHVGVVLKLDPAVSVAGPTLIIFAIAVSLMRSIK